MITEIAEIQVKLGSEAEFEAGVAAAAPLFKRAKGCISMGLRRMEEQKDRYQLVVEWETLEDHTVTFRNSADFQEWRVLVGSFFASPPVVSHWHNARTFF